MPLLQPRILFRRGKRVLVGNFFSRLCWLLRFLFRRAWRSWAWWCFLRRLSLKSNFLFRWSIFHFFIIIFLWWIVCWRKNALHWWLRWIWVNFFYIFGHWSHLLRLRLRLGSWMASLILNPNRLRGILFIIDCLRSLSWSLWLSLTSWYSWFLIFFLNILRLIFFRVLSLNFGLFLFRRVYLFGFILRICRHHWSLSNIWSLRVFGFILSN